MKRSALAEIDGITGQAAESLWTRSFFRFPEIGGPRGDLWIVGRAFQPGVRIVLGRGAGVALPLPTHALDEQTLVGDLPRNYIGRADDLTVAVASADLTQMANALPLVSTAPDAVEEDDPDPDRPVDEELHIDEISGDLFWNLGDQRLRLSGRNVAPGLVVRIGHDGHVFSAVAVPIQGKPTPGAEAGRNVATVEVTVPAAVTDHPIYAVRVAVQEVGNPGTRIDSALAYLYVMWHDPTPGHPPPGEVDHARDRSAPSRRSRHAWSRRRGRGPGTSDEAHRTAARTSRVGRARAPSHGRG